MPNKNLKPSSSPSRASTHIPTSTRGRGKRLTKKEREEAQETFLSAYALNGNIMLSCRRANVDRSTFHKWCEHDQLFSFKYNIAKEEFADYALAEFRKRAMEGYEKPVISMGRVVYKEIPILNEDGTPKLDSKGKPLVKRGEMMMERVVSDNLLAMLIKRHFPEYREKQQVEHSGSVDVTGAKDALLQRLAALARYDQEDSNAQH